MAWTIAEVARMARVTSRALRHYDEVGLVPPAYVGANGYRYYEQEQLLRLQEVLLLRELGVGLPTIAEVLSGQRDRVEALRGHEGRLRAERDRLDRLAATVARTVAHLEEEIPVTAPDLFDGFADRSAEAEESLGARFGVDARAEVAATRARTAHWTREDHLTQARRFDDVEARLADLLRAGATPDSEPVLDVVAEHHAGVSRYWTPDRESYSGLGRLYADDPEWRARFDERRPGLAEYLRDALAAYASRRLP